MKIQISQSEFFDALSQVQGAVSSRASMPILSTVLIEAKEDKIYLTTTDLEVTLRRSVSAKVEKEGFAALPARRLTSIVKELIGSEVFLSTNDKQESVVENGKSFFKIFGMDPKDFPAQTDFKDYREALISKQILREALQKTSYAISKDETRYVLNGIFVSLKKDKFSFVATDGRRLAIYTDTLEKPFDGEAEFILPSKAVSEFQKIAEGEQDLVMKILENQVSLESEDALLVSKLIEGNYPDYKQVIPSETKYMVQFERESLCGVIRRIALLAEQDKSSSVKLSFENSNLTVTANAPEIGEAKESLPINYNGDSLEVAFNPDYIMDPLRHLKSKTIDFELIDEISPAILREGEKFSYVLMPMRLAS